MNTRTDYEDDDDYIDDGIGAWPEEQSSSRRWIIPLALALLLAIAGGGYAAWRALVPVDYQVRANEALAQEDYAAAIIDLKHLIQQNPQDGELRWLLGDTYLKLDQQTYAAEYLEEAFELGYRHPDLLISLARAKLMVRDYEEALKLYREYSDVDSLLESSDWEVIRGRSLLNLGRQERAVEAFFQALRFNPDNTEAKWGLAQAGIGSDLAGLTSDEVERALSTGLDEPETWILRGEMELSQGNFRDSQVAFEKAVELGPTNVYALAGLVRILVATGQLDAAAEPVEALAYQYPAHPMSAYVRALYARQIHEYQRALDALDVVFDHEPNHAMSVLLQGEVNQAMGNYELAMDSLGLFHRMMPSSVLGRKRFAEVLIETENYERAVSLLEPLVDQVHNDPEIASILATAYLRMGDTRRAKAYQSLSYKLDAEGAGARLAVQQLNMGDAEQAVQEMQAVVAQDPEQIEARIMLALSQMRAGQGDAALESARALVVDYPDDPQAHYLLGTVTELSGDPMGAVVHYETALDKDASYSAAELGLARIEMDSGQRARARERISQLVARDPDNATAQVWMAQMLMQEGNSQDAINRLEAARAADRSALQPRLILADIYLQSRNVEGAMSVAREISRLAPTHPVGRYLLANAYVISGDPAAGLEIMADLEKTQPDNLRLKWRMLEAQESMDDDEAVYQTLNKIRAVDATNSRALVKLAMLERGRGNDSEAARLAGELTEHHPESGMGFLIQGQLMMDDGNYLVAADFLQRAYELNRDPVSVSRYYMSMMRAGESARAEQVMSDWLDRNPSDSISRLAVAEEAKRIGDNRRAVREYEWVSRQEPDNVPVLVMLANGYHALGDRRDLKTAQRAYELAPEDAYAKHIYAWLLVDTGLAERGAEILREVVVQAPDNATFRYHLAVALDESGEQEQARDVLQALANRRQSFPEQADAQRLMEKYRVTPDAF